MRFFTSESVTEGHPDKMADRISDSILDAILERDPEARVACETMVASSKVILAGEIGYSQELAETDHLSPGEIEHCVREALRHIGYTFDEEGFHADRVPIGVLLNNQSADIAAGVSVALEARRGAKDPLDQLGAGDQGLMFGYANRETDELMPAPIRLAHRLAERLTEVRRAGVLEYLRPDGKTQVTVRYEDNAPVAVPRVLISSHHSKDVPSEQMEDDLRSHVLKAIGDELIDDDTELLVNPTGRFEIGGPEGDAGLTGRKIIVDTYGGYARHGGGAFSGKDPTKVDRSAAYFARYVAKNVVAARLAERCEIQVAYAIGMARPFSVDLETFGTSEVDPAKLATLVADFFDFRPAAILKTLRLRRPIYARTAAYGHFGRPSFPWESTEPAGDLKAAAGSL
ncbi:MAG: methionine adenosyltransferase [bacterium]|nr:methionine adenosyltransferase [bacterium]MDE0288404.1 methionine adenosyltransferase [bacterium]MDE0438732.1 methionine adenosyltransferase [bacterium]